MILKVIEKLGNKYHLCRLLQYCLGERKVFILTSVAPRKKENDPNCCEVFIIILIARI